MDIEKAVIATESVAKSRSRLRRFVLRPSVCSICASFGIFGGLSALFIGLVCVVVHAIAASERVFDRVGTVLLILAIPTILTGSIFLDEINQKP